MKNEKTKIVHESLVKKSRSKYECPEKIKDLIGTLNLVQGVETLPDVSDMDHEDFEKLLLSFPQQFRRHLSAKATAVVDKLFPKEHKDRDTAIAVNVRYEYQEFLTMRQDFRKLAGDIADARNNTEHLDAAVRVPDFPRLIDREINSEGVFKATIAGLDAILNGVYIDRLRACEICDSFLWAENKNSFTCSEKCRNALRQRRHRSKNKEVIKTKLTARKSKSTEALK